FYAECLGGKVGQIFRYAGTPMAAQVPSDWHDKVMHSTLAVGDCVLMGGDVAPERYEKPQGFSLSLHISSVADAERVFHLLARDGTIVMPFEKTFWAERFGMIIDRFGISWLINGGGSD